MNRVWIFGYGSLIWRPDFPFAERREVCLKGWSRRFWQGSTDHRGVPGSPGRVVTLVEGGTCWGASYRLHPEDVEGIMVRLDYREKGGYERRVMSIGDMDAVVYFANSSNPNWLGPAPVEQIAQTIRSAQGPSGTNLEYLQRLVESLGPHVDLHSRELWERCRTGSAQE